MNLGLKSECILSFESDSIDTLYTESSPIWAYIELWKSQTIGGGTLLVELRKEACLGDITFKDSLFVRTYSNGDIERISYRNDNLLIENLHLNDGCSAYRLSVKRSLAETSLQWPYVNDFCIYLYTYAPNMTYHPYYMITTNNYFRPM